MLLILVVNVNVWLTFSLEHGICIAKPEKWHFRSGRKEGMIPSPRNASRPLGRTDVGMELERVLKGEDRDGDSQS